MGLEGSYLISLGETQDWLFLALSPFGLPVIFPYHKLWGDGHDL